ncbi:MAG: hypothetical protein IKP71_02000 [Candidatus Riflebacteria bacterium]|nr:hypothetical protein [Candidatus Riflebacteria bacterium]
MKRTYLSLILAATAFSMPLQAAETANETNTEKAPWLKGVTIEMVPSHITPVIPMKLYLENGEQIPKELTEDEPITIQADSDIFFDEAPTKDRDMEIPNTLWEANPSVNWQIIDWETNKNTTCSDTPDLAPNVMVVIPVIPTNRGALTCFAGRRMGYDDVQTGRRTNTFANSSAAKDVKIKDITPPTCGLEITVVEGPSGSIYPVENPPNHYPLPKTADLIMTGSIFNGDPDFQDIESGFVLGPDMIAPEEKATINIAQDSVIKLVVIGQDNYKLNTDKVKYGICNGAGGEPTPVCQENQPEYDLSKIKIPENPHIYLDATDMAGNREVLFVPLKIK